ncbi:helix-turn-helix domain-containing protein [Microlunatus soli]|uniref:Helix-turn-helix domain-containing protein n=1 Tax=Microlunatus soli TaxID=630515 RepID=A0A1H1Y2Q5_9ACTN|nr:helix-turn-helix transcriptional regulator [Microlunatus soli]SDT15715.1 Helix-turn-helix domain-containing protein [Microlunatus soli]
MTEHEPYSGRVTSPDSLGRILQQARLLAGLSQRELADRIGASQRYIWEIESGKPSIFVERLFSYMTETGVSLTATVNPPVANRDDSAATRGGAQSDG